MKQAQKEEEEREFRHVPYFATTSFRHLALELPDEIAVTRLTAETRREAERLGIRQTTGA